MFREHERFGVLGLTEALQLRKVNILRKFKYIYVSGLSIDY